MVEPPSAATVSSHPGQVELVHHPSVTESPGMGCLPSCVVPSLGSPAQTAPTSYSFASNAFRVGGSRPVQNHVKPLHTVIDCPVPTQQTVIGQQLSTRSGRVKVTDPHAAVAPDGLARNATNVTVKPAEKDQLFAPLNANSTKIPARFPVIPVHGIVKGQDYSVDGFFKYPQQETPPDTMKEVIIIEKSDDKSSTVQPEKSYLGGGHLRETISYKFPEDQVPHSYGYNDKGEIEFLDASGKQIFPVSNAEVVNEVPEPPPPPKQHSQGPLITIETIEANLAQTRISHHRVFS